AVYSSELNIFLKYHLSDFNSVFEAESFAILHTLVAISDSNCKKAVIASDSLSVLTFFNSPDIKGKYHPLVYMMRDIIHNLYLQNITIAFIWIPEHHNIPGNEAVDLLAKE
ncbi:hypothetical protein EAI_07164, partial [Harpegnathos saltator]